VADQHQAGELAQQIARKTAVSPTTSATPAGRAETKTADDAGLDTDLVEAINQVFALFRLNYHNQYYAAWSEAQQLGQVKRLWLEALGHFSSDLILMGARRAIEGSEYLPTLNRMLASCSEALGELGLPTASAAYEEACLAPSPKAEAAWTHPIAYLAGRDAGWYLLANHQRSEAWPAFQAHYNQWLRRALAGETLTIPERKAISAPREEDAMSTDERKEALSALKEQLGF
jgi:hypothetical protein